MRQTGKRIVAAALGIVVVILLILFVSQRQKAAAPAHNQTPATAGNSRQQSQATNFDKTRYATNKPDSIWVVVNKQRPLNPKDYAPAVTVPNVPLRLSADDGEMHVSTQMAPALEKLFAGAQAAGVPLRLASGYRSYQLQVSVYGAEVKNYGQAQADSESARPGYSEHQTGLAADLEPLDRSCEVADCFGQTPAGKWLAANAYKYGFILRYTPDKTAITGYRAEAWHVRYVGTDLSNELHNTHTETLEEFFGLPAAPDYPAYFE